MEILGILTTSVISTALPPAFEATLFTMTMATVTTPIVFAICLASSSVGLIVGISGIITAIPLL